MASKYWHDKQKKDDAKVFRRISMAIVATVRAAEMPEIDRDDAKILREINTKLLQLASKYGSGLIP